MKLPKIKYLLTIIVLVGIAWMLKDSFSQPGTKDLAGDFKELDFYRNENNTGPIIRIYAVSVSDTLYKEMVAYGNLQPHTKYGTTKIYFFRKRLPKAININSAEPYFDQKFNRYCIGVYEKNGMGNVSFSRGL